MALKTPIFKISERKIFLLFLCHNEHTYQDLGFYVQYCGLWQIQRIYKEKRKNDPKKRNKLKIMKTEKINFFSMS